MKRVGLLATAIAAACCVSPPSAAAKAHTGLDMQVHIIGTVAAFWRGDPARGCAPAGVCSVNGSATYKPSFVGHLSLELEGGFGLSSPGLPGPIVVRVQDGVGAAAVTCADASESFFSPLTFSSFGGTLTAEFEDLGLSGGRCAGPRAVDLVRALPRGSIATARIRSGPQVLNLSGSTRFAAGPFSGSLNSSVKVVFTRARLTRDRSGNDLLPAHIRVARGREAGLELTYRIAAGPGALATDFRGVPNGACAPLGACSLSGSSTFAIPSARGELELFATRPLRRGAKPPTYRAALRALRRGALPITGFANFSGGRATVSESLASPSGGCRDTVFTELPQLDLNGHDRMLKVRLSSQGLSGDDSLRTHCPGPSENDVIDRHPIARGAVPLSALGNHDLRVVVGTTRAFAHDGYAGQRHGALELSLKLVDASAVIGTGF